MKVEIDLDLLMSTVLMLGMSLGFIIGYFLDSTLKGRV